jgi:flavin reductase (DIM6/NTAB) family NADH-FMN oxidoreductase RutF
MDLKALHQLSYGLYIVTSVRDAAVNGQAANAVMQICSNPVIVAVGINKQNLTHEYIQSSRRMTISILEQDTPLSLIGRFGFKSGRNLDKFEGVAYEKTSEGLPYLTDHALSYLEAEVNQEVDASTHTLFIGEVTGCEVLKEGEPMTYAFYHQVKRGGVPPSAPTYISKEKTGSVR